MTCKTLIALAIPLFVAACAAEAAPTEGTDPTPATGDPAEKAPKTENTSSTSEALVAPVCGKTTCGIGTHCCGCANHRFCGRICPDIACAAD